MHCDDEKPNGRRVGVCHFGMVSLRYFSVYHRCNVDAVELRKRVWKKISWAPSVVVPVVGGAALLASSVVLGPLAAFGGIAACLIGAGLWSTRALTKVESLTAKAMGEMQREAERKQAVQLDMLDSKLQTDGDRRTESLLRDLRVLMRQFDEARELRDPGLVRQVVEVESKSQRLFQSCVRSLERSYELWLTSRQLSTPAARNNALERRERLIKEVETSVQHLGTIFEGLHSLGGAGEDVQEMARIRTELDRTLDSAKRVEERMRQLDDELGVGRVRE